jgi:3-deoxy-D-manno-octulosonic-acid transferase
MRRPFPLKVYRLVSHLAAPVLPLWLARRQKAGKEDPARLGERMGVASLPRPEGKLIWLHGASVGETMSILPLIEKLSGVAQVLLTTGTVTSADLAARRLPKGAIHQFIPVDLPGAVARFFDHWRPDLVLFCESEIWPNLLGEAHRRAVPVGLVNARMSARSFRRWQKLPSLSTALLGPLALCTAQSEGDAERFRALGAPARMLGNLKHDVPPLPLDAGEHTRLLAELGGRPVWLAASTHPGEEEQVLEAARQLRVEWPGLLTIIVPRHPQRGADIAALAASQGERVPRRSLGARPAAGDAFHLADTLGELGLFYALADVALIGGSLIPHGGHNPIEAVKRDAPVISGPSIENFREIYADLVEAGGAIVLASASDLAPAVAQLLREPGLGSRLDQAAKQALARHEGALQRSFEAILPLLKAQRPDP